jgi:CPA2 family monovalent cation:H+ antiporter-2
MGVRLELLSSETYNLILASALISIAINPLLFKLADSIATKREEPPSAPA